MSEFKVRAAKLIPSFRSCMRKDSETQNYFLEKVLMPGIYNKNNQNTK